MDKMECLFYNIDISFFTCFIFPISLVRLHTRQLLRSIYERGTFDSTQFFVCQQETVVTSEVYYFRNLAFQLSDWYCNLRGSE
jgi:hypothetical protein